MFVCSQSIIKDKNILYDNMQKMYLVVSNYEIFSVALLFVVLTGLFICGDELSKQNFSF